MCHAFIQSPARFPNFGQIKFKMISAEKTGPEHINRYALPNQKHNLYFLNQMKSMNVLGVLELVKYDKIFPIIGENELVPGRVPPVALAWDMALEAYVAGKSKSKVVHIPYIVKFYADYCGREQSDGSDAKSLGALIDELHAVHTQLRHSIDDCIQISRQCFTPVQVRTISKKQLVAIIYSHVCLSISLYRLIWQRQCVASSPLTIK